MKRQQLTVVFGLALTTMVGAGFSIAGGLFLGWEEITERSHIARCPTDTFFISGTSGTIVLMAEMMLGVGLGFSLVLWLLDLWPGARSAYESFPKSSNATSYRGIQKGFAIFTIVCLPLAISSMVIRYFNETCLTPTAIWRQSAPWSGLRSYPWSDVAEVRPACWHFKGGWGTGLALILKNGADIKFSSATVVGSPTQAYAPLRQALQGHDFKFNTTEISPDCPAPDRLSLAQRP